MEALDFLIMVVSIDNAEHYVWGEICEGWHLLKRTEMSVIQERVPPGGTEVMHYHEKARQFFYVLEGEGMMVFDAEQITLRSGEGLEIALQVNHQFTNSLRADVHFLVISVPSTRGDRINL